MRKVRDFKFGVQIDRQACKPKNAKAGQEGHHLHHVTYFYNFGTPCPPSHLSETDTTNKFLHLKNSITPILFPLPPTIPVLSGKLSTTYYIASHPYLYLPTPQPAHLLTALPPSSLKKISKLCLALSANSSTDSPHSVPPSHHTSYLLYFEACL